jgi:hypothetical protein
LVVAVMVVRQVLAQMVLIPYFLLLRQLAVAVVAAVILSVLMVVQVVAVAVILKRVELELQIKDMQVELVGQVQEIVKHQQAAAAALMLLEQQVYQVKQVMAAMV